MELNSPQSDLFFPLIQLTEQFIVKSYFLTSVLHQDVRCQRFHHTLYIAREIYREHEDSNHLVSLVVFCIRVCLFSATIT